jgi:hypothetical protein
LWLVILFTITVYNQLKQYKPLLCQTSNSNGQQYNQPQQYEPLLCQTSNSNGQQYNQLEQYEPLLCQTSNSNGQQYNSHNNMNRSSVKSQTVMVNSIANHSNMKYSYHTPLLFEV